MALPKEYLLYSNNDLGFVQKLRFDLAEEIKDVPQAILHEYAAEDLGLAIKKRIDDSQFMFVVLSAAAYDSEWLLQEIKYGITVNKPMIFLKINKFDDSSLVKLFDNTGLLHQVDFTDDYISGKDEFVSLLNIIDIGMADLDPIQHHMGFMITPPSRSAARPTRAINPALAKTEMAKPASPPKGKILYDIPDHMTVNKQVKCAVRVGKDELTVKDDDEFSDAMKIEDITLSGMMKVELIDIADEPHFSIKSISTPEQEVDEESFTEWLFYVTPLRKGEFELILKVTVIHEAEGKERMKDIVFRKQVSIDAAEKELVTPTGTTTAPNYKSVLHEPGAQFMDRLNVFISYAHDDRSYFDIFLNNLRSQSTWNIWTDKNIEIGSGWFDSIQASIQVSDLAVLLVSANFISSPFIEGNEFTKFAGLKDSNPYFIFAPVLLRDVDFTRWKDLADMQFFTAYAREYGIADDSKDLLPFARLCEYSRDGLLLPNAFRDTYFKNFVKKVDFDWLKNKLAKAS